MSSRRVVRGGPQIGKSERDSSSLRVFVANGSPRLNWVLTASMTCDEVFLSSRESTEIISCWILTAGRMVPVNSRNKVVLVLLCAQQALRKI